MKSFQEKIDFLKKCAALYETNGTSPLTDEEYDKEYTLLKSQDPDNEFFKSVGGIEEEFVYGKQIKHEITMGSLNKSPDIEDFETWLKNTYKDREKDFISGKLSFTLQYKIDGLSLGCLYKKGKLIQVLTRGDGETGISVTENAKYIEGIPQNIACQEEIELRGEGYKDRKDFYENWAGEYKNPRNFTSGSINQKDPLITKERGLSFICYEVVRKDFETELDKINFIQSLKFQTIASSTSQTHGSFKEMAEDIKKFMSGINRYELPFDIDGIVVKLSQIEVAKSMGYTDNGKRPKSNRAVKFECEQKTTTLKDVEFGIGRTGNLTLVGLLEPVELAGTTVSRASLHNPKFVKKNEINIGSKLLIQKSGDIIPYVVKKIASGEKEIEIPELCPSCGSNLEWDDNEVTLHCGNFNCPSQFSQRIDKWFKTVGVRGIGEGILDRILQLEDGNGKSLVFGIPDFYTLEKYNDILKKEFGPKAAINIIDNIASIKGMPLGQFIEALGIAKIGSMAKEIVKIAPTIEAIDKLTTNELLSIGGFAEIKAKCFVDGWSKIRKDVDKMLQFITIEKEKEKMSSKLNGQSFCITGTLSKTRDEFVEMIESNGGKSASGVSSKLNFLIAGEDCGGKKKKAESLGVKIISEKEFMDMLQ